MKHTPGSWYEQINDNGDGQDPRKVVASHFLNPNVRVTVCDGILNIDDARLIAAAPDLLAALEALVQKNTDSPEHLAAQAAIAKAKGE
jgi:hypothetical protein